MKVLIFVLAAVFCYASARVTPWKVKRMIQGRSEDGLVPHPPEEYRRRAATLASVTTNYFTQIVDHSDPNNKNTWQQMYQTNNQYYKAGGPIFVMIGGEGAADIGWMTYGQWYKNAQTYGALMFQLEHRFYGQSHPTSDASDANLKLLTSQQALADLDNFINAMKTKYNAQKVIAFGGSYPGNLAAWYRLKYPDTTLGTIASSAPVTPEVDFYQYLETVGYAMDYFEPGCYEQAQLAYSALQTLVQNGDVTNINKYFNPCSPGLNLTDPYSVYTFYDSLIGPWQGAVQYTAPDAATSEAAAYCRTMLNTALGSPLQRLSALAKEWSSCTYVDYNQEINLMKQTSWKAPYVQGGSRQWIWQTCNEFGYYQSTDSDNQPFGRLVPVSYLEDIYCTRVFGTTTTQIANNAAATQKTYGGTTGSETKVFFVNGSVDPWHNLSAYLAAPNSQDISQYINGTSHCYDMDNARLTDPAQLTQVRNQITSQIGLWLNA